MRDIVKEAQAIIDDFILASVETTREVQMRRYKKSRKKKIIAGCVCFLMILAAAGIVLAIKRC